MIAANQMTKAGRHYFGSVVPLLKAIPAVHARQPVLLVVDNYPPGQRLLRELALYTGLDTIVCTTVAEAQTCLDENFVVGVVMDSDMLGRAWDEFAQKLAGSLTSDASMPVIKLRTYPFSAAVPEIGVTVVLQKPICVTQFFDMLDRCIAPRLEHMRMATQRENFQHPAQPGEQVRIEQSPRLAI